MNFQLIGVNHQTAPVEVRERLAITESRLPDALKQFAQHPGVEEALILCTCNRVELLAQTKNGSADLRGFLRNYFQIEPSELDKHLYEFHEQDAINFGHRPPPNYLSRKLHNHQKREDLSHKGKMDQ